MNDNPTALRRHELTLLGTYMVRRFHPRRILIDMAALPWSVYFLWQHDWVLALAVGLAGAALGMLATSGMDTARYSQTLMGRMAFLHLQPVNVVTQLVGIVTLIWALWTHSGTGILGSMSVIFLGHLAGWDEVLGESTALTAEEEAA